jgi:hypothetical protein
MNIRFHWGAGITLVLILFALMLFTLAYISYRQDRQLVREDYYYHEIHHQSEIDALGNFAVLGQNLVIRHAGERLILEFPAILGAGRAQGHLELMRPNDASLDKRFDIAPDTTGRVEVPSGNLTAGKYLLKATLVMADRKYCVEKEIVIQN